MVVKHIFQEIAKDRDFSFCKFLEIPKDSHRSLEIPRDLKDPLSFLKIPKDFRGLKTLAHLPSFAAFAKVWVDLVK